MDHCRKQLLEALACLRQRKLRFTINHLLSAGFDPLFHDLKAIPRFFPVNSNNYFPGVPRIRNPIMHRLSLSINAEIRAQLRK